MDLTQEYVCKYLYLKDGSLYWKRRAREEFSCDRIFKSWNTRYPNTKAECEHEPKPGYKCKVTRLNKKLYKTHRLIFLIHYGYLPDKIDHKDGNALNNCPCNLRETTSSQNSCNSKIQSNNTSGYKGVCYDKVRRNYMAYINVNGNRHNLGRHKTALSAALVYNEYAIKYHGEFAKLNEV